MKQELLTLSEHLCWLMSFCDVIAAHFSLLCLFILIVICFWSLYFTLFISLYWFTIILSRHVVFCLSSLHSQTTHKINHLMFFLLIFSGCFQLNTSLITSQFYTEDALECSKNCTTHFGLMVRAETVIVTVIFGI